MMQHWAIEESRLEIATGDVLLYQRKLGVVSPQLLVADLCFKSIIVSFLNKHGFLVWIKTLKYTIFHDGYIIKIVSTMMNTKVKCVI